MSSQEVEKLLVDLQHNGNKVFKFVCGVDTGSPHIETSVEVGSDRLYKIYGGLHAPNNILFDVKTSHASNEVQDIKIDIILTPDGKVLKVDFFWRPDLPSDIDESLHLAKGTMLQLITMDDERNHLNTLKTIMTMTLSDISRDLQNALDNDMVEKWIEPLNSFRRNFASLTLYQYQLVQHISNGVGEATEYVLTVTLEMAENGLLACKSFIAMSNVVLQNTMRTAFQWMEVMKLASQELLQNFGSKLHVLDLQLETFGTSEAVEKFLHVMKESLEFWASKASQVQNTLIQIPISLSQDIEQDIHEFLQGLATSIRKVKSMNQILAFYLDYQSWFEEIHLSSRLQDVYTDLRL